jgi:DNA-binding transcriptional regulator YdaS (Cro superfamily)
MNAHIAKALSLFGGQQAMANACGVTQAAVSKWVRGHRVSAESAIAIERATSGRVTRFELRPDLWPAPPARPLDAAREAA